MIRKKCARSSARLWSLRARSYGRDGEMGLSLLETDRVNVLITDTFMPGQDGIVTVRRIRIFRQAARGDWTPVIDPMRGQLAALAKTNA
jgi:DNA-binding NarL/FixJ family response regulator